MLHEKKGPENCKHEVKLHPPVVPTPEAPHELTIHLVSCNTGTTSQQVTGWSVFVGGPFVFKGLGVCVFVQFGGMLNCPIFIGASMPDAKAQNYYRNNSLRTIFS